MSGFFNTWLVVITSASVLTAVLEALLPEGGVKKLCVFVLGVFMMFCILTPLVDMFGRQNGFDLTKTFESLTKDEERYQEITEKNYKDIVEKLYTDNQLSINEREEN